MHRSSTTVHGVPRVPPEHLRRPRLIDRIDPLAALTVVRAPGGGGKTALLAEWAGQRTGPRGVWVTLAASDGGRQEFWTTVTGDLQGAGVTTPASLMASIAHVAATAGDLRRQLVRAFNQLDDRLVLVLDDYEHVRDPAVHEDLLTLAEQCAGLSVVVLTRTRSPLEAPAVALRVDRTVIAAEEVTFTREETAELLRAHEAEAAADAVHDLTGGNPLQIRTLLLEARTSGTTVADVGSLHRLHGDVVRHALSHVFGEDLADGLGHFVLRTSVAEVLDPELAAELGGVQDARPAMERLEATGIGSWLEDQPRMRYHPLVREALREEAARRLPTELPGLHAAVATWELAQGRGLLALRHAVAAGDVALASQVLMRHWWEMMGDLPQLQEILAPVPLSQLRLYPLVSGVLAMAYNADGRRRARAIQLFALTLWGVRHRRPRADVTERVVLDVLEIGAQRVIGIGRGLRRARAVAEILAEPDDRLVVLHPQLRVLQTLTAVSLFRLGHPEESLGLLDAALTLRPGESEHATHTAIALRAGVFAHVGAMGEAGREVEAAEALDWPEGARDDYGGALYHYARAWQWLEQLDGPAALAQVQRLAPHLETLEYQPYFVVVQAFAQALDGGVDGALTMLEEYEAADRGKRRSMAGERDMVRIARAILHLFAGRPGAAQQLLDKVTATAGSQMVRAAIALAGGRPEETVERLATAEGTVAPRVSAARQLLLAAAALRMGDRATALDAATRLVATMEHHRLRLHLVLVPHSDLLAVRDLLAAERPRAAAGLGDLEQVPRALGVVRPVLMPSDRELVVLGALRTTASTTEIAERLGVSPNTVKSQLRSLYRKLGAGSREEALAVALREDLLG